MALLANVRSDVDVVCATGNHFDAAILAVVIIVLLELVILALMT